MLTNDLLSLSEEGANQQGSIFNELLQHYSNPEIEMIDSEDKLF